MKLGRMIVRRERVAKVVEALRQAGVPRFFVCPTHALGSCVDPELVRRMRELQMSRAGQL